MKKTGEIGILFYIYFDNPSAWPIGDFYKTHREILNAGFENKTKYGPLGWELSLPQNSDTVAHVSDLNSLSKRRCKLYLSR